jgi:hypothetical protein
MIVPSEYFLEDQVSQKAIEGQLAQEAKGQPIDPRQVVYKHTLLALRYA